MQQISRKKAGVRGLRQIFGAPVILGLLSCIGLLAALIGDGPFDAASWLMLGLPVGLVAWFASRR